MNHLNKKLKVNPNAVIPKNYVKKLDKAVDFVYILPENLPVVESEKTCYEIVDSLFTKLLKGFGAKTDHDIHLIEPISEIYYIARAEKVKDQPLSNKYKE